MPGLGFQQAVVELRQLVIQARCQGGEALAGAGFDDGADDQYIHQAAGVILAHRFAQAGGVAGRSQVGIGHAPLYHDRQHLLEVPQLFAGQAGHFVQQVGVVHIPVHQAQGGGGCFLFAVGVVNQHQVLVGQGVLNPLGRRSAGQEIVYLLQGFVHGFGNGPVQQAREYNAPNRSLRPLSNLTLYGLSYRMQRQIKESLNKS